MAFATCPLANKKKLGHFFLNHDQRNPVNSQPPLPPSDSLPGRTGVPCTPLDLHNTWALGGSRSASYVGARSMSSSVASVDIAVPNHHFLTSTREPRPHGTPQEQPAARSEAPVIPEALVKDSRAKEHEALKARRPTPPAAIGTTPPTPTTPNTHHTSTRAPRPHGAPQE